MADGDWRSVRPDRGEAWREQKTERTVDGQGTLTTSIAGTERGRADPQRTRGELYCDGKRTELDRGDLQALKEVRQAGEDECNALHRGVVRRERDRRFLIF